MRIIDDGMMIIRSKRRANVLHFGAIGDGITDDTVAVQSAINWARENDAVIVFPPGDYLVAVTLDTYLVHLPKDIEYVC